MYEKFFLNANQKEKGNIKGFSCCFKIILKTFYLWLNDLRGSWGGGTKGLFLSLVINLSRHFLGASIFKEIKDVMPLIKVSHLSLVRDNQFETNINHSKEDIK